MIHVNVNEEVVEDGGTVHLWLESMVEDRKKAQTAVYFPVDPALCGYELGNLEAPPTERNVDNHVKRASTTVFGDSLADLLGNEQVCEECKIRAAVYYDVTDEVHLDARYKGNGGCPECGIYKRTNEILGVTNEVVKRQWWCEGCGHEWEDEVPLTELGGD